MLRVHVGGQQQTVLPSSLQKALCFNFRPQRLSEGQKS